MTDKEKLYLLNDYVTTILNNRIALQFEKGKFGTPRRRFNKVECAYLDGGIDALNKVREFIVNELIREEK